MLYDFLDAIKRLCYVHKTGYGEVGDVVGEREMRIKSNTKIANRSIRDESCGRRVIEQDGVLKFRTVPFKKLFLIADR